MLTPGGNYGWPLVSFGRTYPGPRQSQQFQGDGFIDPVVFWVPSISTSGLAFYTGDKLPKWQGDIFVGGMRYGEIPNTGRLERILINEKMEELRREPLLVDLRQRIRDVRQGPDGLLYLLRITTKTPRCCASRRRRSLIAARASLVAIFVLIFLALAFHGGTDACSNGAGRQGLARELARRSQQQQHNDQ